ncbi:c-type cytochrome [Lysobacter niabensis]|uniref:c-type cytochrome n=1 Tax=Agrilutibacter niabensis TaxID=380628 RepID=UPI003612232D
MSGPPRTAALFHGILLVLVAGGLAGCNVAVDDAAAAANPPSQSLSPALIAQGKRIFRFDTFGDEQQWTDRLRMHEVVETVPPLTALAVGLKVDAEALPPGLLANADLDDPATTVALLKLDAVVGLKATVDADNRVKRLGITCALCHSTVDDSLAPGVGRRVDGWPNRDLDPGAIIALSPAVPAAAKAVYTSWGPGKYDPRFNIDGLNTPLVLPPAYGLRHIRNETYTGDGRVSYWNAYVAVTQMGGHGNFADPRLGIAIRQSPDLVTPKLPALRAYQLSLAAPRPPAGSYDAIAARRGRPVFARNCMGCHVGATGTDNNGGKLHLPAETGMDGAYAARTVNKAYRTTPLRGLWQHPPYFHDGSAATLADVVAHYDATLRLRLTPAQRRDLVEYLKTL